MRSLLAFSTPSCKASLATRTAGYECKVTELRPTQEPQMVKCEICGREFKRRPALNRNVPITHRGKHTGEESPTEASTFTASPTKRDEDGPPAQENQYHLHAESIMLPISTTLSILSAPTNSGICFATYLSSASVWQLKLAGLSSSSPMPSCKLGHSASCRS